MKKKVKYYLLQYLLQNIIQVILDNKKKILNHQI